MRGREREGGGGEGGEGGGGEGARVEDDEEDCSVYIVQLTYAPATAAQLHRTET